MAKANKGGSSKSGKSKGGKSAKDAKPNVFVRFVQYLRDVWAELRRVVWPGRTEVLNSSVVVIVTVLFFVAFTFIIDNISTQFVQLVARLGG
jgi:preprotein translocase subunit SecE